MLIGVAAGCRADLGKKARDRGWMSWWRTSSRCAVVSAQRARKACARSSRPKALQAWACACQNTNTFQERLEDPELAVGFCSRNLGHLPDQTKNQVICEGDLLSCPELYMTRAGYWSFVHGALQT